MKAALSIAVGFGLTLIVFFAGAASTAYLLAAPSVHGELDPDQSELWTATPKVVQQAASQPFRRIPVRVADPAPASAAGSEAAMAEAELPDTGLDLTPTAAVGPQTGGEAPSLPAELSAAHVEWCANRYRSYRPRDNSYTPYSGGRRTCMSPFVKAASGQIEASPAADWAEGYEDEDPSFGTSRRPLREPA